MNKDKLEQELKRSKVDAIRRKDDEYNEEIRRKVLELKSKGEDINWNPDKKDRAKRSIKKAVEGKGLFKNLINKLKD